MGRVEQVPGWVRRPVLVVAEVEDFLLRLWGRTKSPQALGARHALAWLGGVDRYPPLTIRTDPVTLARAVAEFAVAEKVSAGDAYPPPQWWASEGAGLDEVLSPQWWDAHAEYGCTANHALGVAVGIGWALGAVADAAVLTPNYDGDGTRIPEVGPAGVRR